MQFLHWEFIAGQKQGQTFEESTVVTVRHSDSEAEALKIVKEIVPLRTNYHLRAVFYCNCELEIEELKMKKSTLKLQKEAMQDLKRGGRPRQPWEMEDDD